MTQEDLKYVWDRIRDIRKRHASVDAAVNRDSGYYQREFGKLAAAVSDQELLFYHHLFRAKVFKQRREYDRAIHQCNIALSQLLLLAGKRFAEPEEKESDWGFKKEVSDSLVELRMRTLCGSANTPPADCSSTGCLALTNTPEDIGVVVAREICKDSAFAYNTVASALFAKARAQTDESGKTRHGLEALNAIRCSMQIVGPISGSLPKFGQDNLQQELIEFLKQLANSIRKGGGGISCLYDVRDGVAKTANSPRFWERITYSGVELCWLSWWLAHHTSLLGQPSPQPTLKASLVKVLEEIRSVHPAHTWAPIVLGSIANDFDHWRRAVESCFSRAVPKPVGLADDDLRPVGLADDDLRRIYGDMLSEPSQSLACQRTVYCLIRALRSSPSTSSSGKDQSRVDQSSADDYCEDHVALFEELENVLDRLLLSMREIDESLGRAIGSPVNRTAPEEPNDPVAQTCPAALPVVERLQEVCATRMQDIAKSAGGRYREDRLICLKTWNSYSPCVPRQGGTRERGGGFLLFWKGIGFAIDPGVNFVENLYSRGFTVNDIDAILVSHSHPDHMADVPVLLQLSHEMRRRGTGDKGRGGFVFYCNQTSAAYLQPMLNDIYFGSPPIHVLRSNDGPVTVGQVKLQALPAQHPEFTKAWSMALGFHFELLPNSAGSIVFTCDTAWGEDSFKKVNSPLDIVVANIGSVYFEELATLEYHKKHLGLKGTYNAVAKLRPRLAIITEFGEELRGYRGAISAAIERALIRNGQFAAGSPDGEKQKIIRCVPGDCGLTISLQHLPALRIECNYPRPDYAGEVCGRLVPTEDLTAGVDVRETDNGIRYLCPQHREA